MALFHLLWLSSLITTAHYSNAQPSPGYYPNLRLRPVRFYHGFTNLWGPQHQWVSGDQSSVTIWLDRNSGANLSQSHSYPSISSLMLLRKLAFFKKSTGSGFKSIRAFRNGYFAASIKLQRGYTAGVITAFYLSNNEAHPGFHDEVDMEFLGTTPGEPYTLQTNVYVRGSGDGRIIGREMKFHLWFDPTANFHSYAILWNQMELIFFVDDIPIRRYARWSAATFPQRPMWVYGSIWDASSWATDDGKYRADYRFQPFVSQFTRFVARGCTAASPPSCRPAPSSPQGFGLSMRQRVAMRWAQRRSLVYDYCRDPKRDHSLTPECRRH